ncbi:MAG TPA: hypothetical protein VFC33_09390 [Acidimicrobiia bacterium]|nr:hypothetical protein [Acidimicrobiia bacterium]
MRTWADVGLLVALGAVLWLVIRLLPRRVSTSLVPYAVAAAITAAGAVALGVRREHRELTARSVAVAVGGMCVVWLLAWLQRPRAPRAEPVATARPEPVATARPEPDTAPRREQPVVDDTYVPMTRRERRQAARRHFGLRRRRNPARRDTRAREDLDPEPA